MKNYTLISCLTVLSLSLIENSHAHSVDKSRCRAAHKECDAVLNLYGVEARECHAHVEKHYGCACEKSVVAPAPEIAESLVAAPSATEIPITTDVVDSDFGGVQGKKGFRNAIEGD